MLRTTALSKVGVCELGQRIKNPTLYCYCPVGGDSPPYCSPGGGGGVLYCKRRFGKRHLASVPFSTISSPNLIRNCWAFSMAAILSFFPVTLTELK